MSEITFENARFIAGLTYKKNANQDIAVRIISNSIKEISNGIKQVMDAQPTTRLLYIEEREQHPTIRFDEVVENEYGS